MSALPPRDYVYLGTTQSLCPHCRELVPAKIVLREGKRVYFRKRCRDHGEFEDFVCSDVAYFDRHEFSQPARLPRKFGVRPERGCPFDCGLCTEHEQHTCIALVEVTSSCNLKCPMCFAESGPGGAHVDFQTYARMVDRYVEVEGTADILQLSGGEPTIHPEILRMVRYAYERPIATVMINTNGIRLAKDERLVAALAEMRDRFEVYLQFDGFEASTNRALRGEEALAEVKLAALENLRKHDVRTTLVCTVDHNTNLHEVGGILRFGLDRPHVRGVSYQLATYCGRHLDPADLERRATMPDLVRALVAQSDGLLAESDFYPLPCAHPNCHMMSYVYRAGGRPVPVSRLVDVRKHLNLVANSIVFTPDRAREIVARAIQSTGDCCGPGGCGPEVPADDFVARALASTLTGADVFRITLTAFLDAHNFDTRRVMKCCIGHVLPSGHVVPFCAYNTLYRDGRVPLPPLQDQLAARRPPAPE